MCRNRGTGISCRVRLQLARLGRLFLQARWVARRFEAPSPATTSAPYPPLGTYIVLTPRLCRAGVRSARLACDLKRS